MASPNVQTMISKAGSWHCRLNRKASQSGLNTYLLFALLANEAVMVAVNAKLLSDKVRCTKIKGTALVILRTVLRVPCYFRYSQDSS